jgi:hypothetical protein
MANKKITDLPQTNSISGSNLVHIVQSNTSYKADITTLAAYLSTVMNIVNAASQVTNTPNGGIASNTVQGALNELDTKKENIANKGISGGYASLDSGGKIPSSQIPAVAVSNTTVVASQSAMLALTAQEGDIAIRTDLNKTFILQTSPASVLGNWKELLTPTDSVLSVNGQTGAVNLTTANVSEGGSNLYFTAARVLATVLTGLSTATNTVITASDNILVSLGKLQKQISNNLENLMLRAGKDYTFLVGNSADCDYIVSNYSDIGAAVNAAIQSLPVGASGSVVGGVVRVKQGKYTWTTDIVMTGKTNVAVVGSYFSTTVLNTENGAKFLINNPNIASTTYKNRISDFYVNSNNSGMGLDYSNISDLVLERVNIVNPTVGIRGRGASYYNNFYNVNIENSSVTAINFDELTPGGNDYPTAHKFFGCKILNGATGVKITKGNQIQFFGCEVENFDVHLDFIGALGCGFFGGRLENTNISVTAILVRLGATSQNNIIDNPYIAANNWIDRDTHFIDNGAGNSIINVANYKDQFVDWVKNLSVDSPFIRFIRTSSGYSSGWGLLELLDRFTNSGNPITLLIQNNRATGWLFKGVRGISPRVKPVLDKDLATPPLSPATGDRYIVASSPTGAWSGQANNIAQWNSSSWVFTTATGSGNFGTGCWVVDESLYYRFNGTVWVSAEMAYITSQGRGWFATGLDNNNQRLLNVATPTASTDAVNKSYVDSNLTTGGFGISPANMGFLTFNYQPFPVITSSDSFANGNAVVIKIPYTSVATIINAHLQVRVAGATLTNSYVALYRDRVEIGKSADQSTAWASTGLKTMVLTETSAGSLTSVPVNSTKMLELVFWVGAATTRPQFARGDSTNFVNGLTTGTNLVFSLVGSPTSTAYTTSTSPTTAEMANRTTHNISYWAGLS